MNGTHRHDDCQVPDDQMTDTMLDGDRVDALDTGRPIGACSEALVGNGVLGVVEGDHLSPALGPVRPSVALRRRVCVVIAVPYRSREERDAAHTGGLNRCQQRVDL